MSNTQIGLSAAAAYEMLQSESYNSLTKFSKPMARAFGLHMLLDEFVASHNISERSAAAFNAAKDNFFACNPQQGEVDVFAPPAWASDAAVVAAHDKMLRDSQRRSQDQGKLEVAIKNVMDNLLSQMSDQEVFDHAESQVGA